jgi:toxin-antitoxin system PIN domain toxin
MSVTLDANLLVYASNESEAVYQQARELVQELAEGPQLVYLFWPTIMGYLRIVTHPGILPRPLAAEQAAANVDALLQRPHIRAPGEAEGFWQLYQATAGRDTRANAVPDAHLVALMRQHGVGVIYTRDRDFRRYDGIDVRDPF